MKDIQKLERLKSIIKLSESVLEQQNELFNEITFKSKKDSLNKMITSLKQYISIIELEKSRFQKKLDRLYDN